MSEINMEELGRDLLKSGADERIIRAIKILGTHINKILAESETSLEERFLDLILNERDYEAHRRSYE